MRRCHSVIARELYDRSNPIKSCIKRRLPRSLWSLGLAELSQAMTEVDYDTAPKERGEEGGCAHSRSKGDERFLRTHSCDKYLFHNRHRAFSFG